MNNNVPKHTEERFFAPVHFIGKLPQLVFPFNSYTEEEKQVLREKATPRKSKMSETTNSFSDAFIRQLYAQLREYRKSFQFDDWDESGSDDAWADPSNAPKKKIEDSTTSPFLFSNAFVRQLYDQFEEESERRKKVEEEDSLRQRCENTKHMRTYRVNKTDDNVYLIDLFIAGFLNVATAKASNQEDAKRVGDHWVENCDILKIEKPNNRSYSVEQTDNGWYTVTCFDEKRTIVSFHTRFDLQEANRIGEEFVQTK